MKATQLLHNLGLRIWLDNITRDRLDNGTLRRCIDELSVTGLTSNPTIFNHAIENSTAYDLTIREKLAAGKSGEALFLEAALEDLTRAADLFRPIYDRTNGVDGGFRWKGRRTLSTTGQFRSSGNAHGDCGSTVCGGECHPGRFLIIGTKITGTAC
jgi:Transaldolase/Fructose-6-phosphate aldolase